MQTNLKRFAVTPAAAAVLAFGAAACGDDSKDSTTAPATTAAAAAAPVALAGKDTKLVLDPATGKVLAANKVTVAPVGPASTAGGGIAFPITAGSINTESLAGTVDHSGGLKFSAGGKSLAVTDFKVDTVSKQLVAQAGGADVPLLNLNLDGVKKASGPNGEIVVSNVSTTLTAQAAAALNKTFGVTLFKAGLPIGDVTITAAAKA
jgi:Htaa